MKIPSKVSRIILSGMLIGFIPDIAIVLLAAWYFDGGFIVFIAVLIGLQILYTIVWTVRSAFGWLLFYLLGRKKMANYYCDILYQNKFPVPKDYEWLDSAETYFLEIMDNKNADIDVRLRSAGILGMFEGIKMLSETQVLFKITLAYEDAIKEYKRSIIRTHD